MAGSMYVQGLQVGLPGVNQISLGPWTYPLSAIGELIPVALTTSPVSLSVPTGAGQVIVSPPSTNTYTITFKTVSGDTGIASSPSLPLVVPFDTATPDVPTTIYLKAAGAVTVTVIFS